MKRSLEEYKNHMGDKPLVLNLGCGHNNRSDFYGIDIQDVDGVDLVADLNNGIPFEDESFNVVLALDFLEHIPQGKPNIKIMEEIYRVLKPDGFLRFEVPSTDWCNTGAFQDPTHISFWNQKKFQYFMKDEFGEGFRALYNIQCHFVPKVIETVNNKWGVTYVRGILIKEMK